MKRFQLNINLNRKMLYMILAIMIVSVASLSIVYAALSVALNIQGNAEVVASTWDIHLDNIKVTSGSVSGTDPSITSPTTATFSTTLNMPGDFYEFTIDVVNGGSLDAMIDGVSKTPTLTTEQAKYLNYIVEYQNGESINTKQLVSKNSYVRLKVRVEFRKDITASDLPTTSETLNLAFIVNYVQSDGTGSNVTDNGATKQLIEFTIDDRFYQAEEGMTWGNWVDSEYSKDEFYFDGVGVVASKSDGSQIFQCVRYDDLIDFDMSYYINHVGSAGVVCGIPGDDL